MVEKSSAKTLAGDFLESTTAHGFGSLIREKLLFGKALWGLIIVGGMAANAWHLSLIVNTYLKYNTQELVKLTHDPAPFPDVTVCNLQPKSRHAWVQMKGSQVVKDFQAATRQIQKLASEYGMNLEAVNGRTLSPTSFFENVGPEEARLVGHRREDFIVGCRYVDSDCSPEDFKHYLSDAFYNCFTFSRNLTRSEDSGFLGSGPRNSLSLIMYLEAENASALSDRDFEVEQHPYNSRLSWYNTLGVRVVIHERGTLPQPIDDGLDGMPGHSSSFAITSKYIERLKKPYGSCDDRDTLHGMERFAYTSSGCMHLCVHTFIYDQCSCVSGSFPVPDALLNLQYCGTFNRSDPASYFAKTSCESSKWSEFTSSKILRELCQCNSPCQSFEYAVQPSYARWPAYSSVEDFHRDVIMKNGGRATEDFQNVTATNTTGFADIVRGNFARVNVYFKDLKTEIRKQEASFPTSTMWSSIGGTMGLWLGVSAITSIEFLVFFTKLVSLLFSRRNT